MLVSEFRRRLDYTTGPVNAAVAVYDAADHCHRQDAMHRALVAALNAAEAELASELRALCGVH